MKALTPRPDDGSTELGTHIVEGESQLWEGILTSMHMYKSTVNKNIKINKCAGRGGARL